MDKIDEEKVNVTIVSGVEGKSIYINDYRICGNKPWGGGTIIEEWKNVDIERFINAFAGKLVEPASKEEIEEIIMNIVRNEPSNDIKIIIKHQAKALVNKIGKRNDLICNEKDCKERSKK